MPNATVPEEVLVRVMELTRVSSAPGAMPSKPEFVKAGALPLFPTVRVPSMVQLPPDPFTKVPPEAVLASRMPLALVVSKLPLLVKVLVALMMRLAAGQNQRAVIGDRAAGRDHGVVDEAVARRNSPREDLRSRPGLDHVLSHAGRTVRSGDRRAREGEGGGVQAGGCPTDGAPGDRQTARRERDAVRRRVVVGQHPAVGHGATAGEVDHPGAPHGQCAVVRDGGGCSRCSLS